MAVEGMEQKPVPTAIPEVALLHGPEGGEAVFGVFVVTVLNGVIGIADAVIGELILKDHTYILILRAFMPVFPYRRSYPCRMHLGSTGCTD